MKSIITDIASLGQDALAKALENKELNISLNYGEAGFDCSTY